MQSWHGEYTINAPFKGSEMISTWGFLENRLLSIELLQEAYTGPCIAHASQLQRREDKPMSNMRGVLKPICSCFMSWKMLSSASRVSLSGPSEKSRITATSNLQQRSAWKYTFVHTFVQRKQAYAGVRLPSRHWHPHDLLLPAWVVHWGHIPTTVCSTLMTYSLAKYVVLKLKHRQRWLKLVCSYLHSNDARLIFRLAKSEYQMFSSWWNLPSFILLTSSVLVECRHAGALTPWDLSMGPEFALRCPIALAKSADVALKVLISASTKCLTRASDKGPEWGLWA